MPINKIVYGQNTLIDLTEDTVTENLLAEGAIAHKADGSVIHGTGLIVSGEPTRIILEFGIEDSDGNAIMDSSSKPIKGNRLFLPF